MTCMVSPSMLNPSRTRRGIAGIVRDSRQRSHVKTYASAYFAGTLIAK